MNIENSKTNEPHKFTLNLTQRLYLKSSHKHVALQNFSIYCTWKNIELHLQKYKATVQKHKTQNNSSNVVL